MNVPYTCPLIDEIITDLKMHRLSGQTKEYIISLNRLETVIEKLEELRKMNMALRYDAGYWKKLYEYTRYGEMDYNPEVLPNE